MMMMMICIVLEKKQVVMYLIVLGEGGRKGRFKFSEFILLVYT